MGAVDRCGDDCAWCAGRASTAANTCQLQLENLVENDTAGLKERIANAEAAVQEAERTAEEAVSLQHEVVKAASMAQGHSDVASAQNNAAQRVTNQPSWLLCLSLCHISSMQWQDHPAA